MGNDVFIQVVEQIGHYILWGLYWILSKIAELANILIKCVRALAGLEPFSYDGTYISPDNYTKSDIFLNLINEKELQNIFISLLVLSVILLFVVTFIAVIKSEWGEFGTGKEVNNKYKIISASIRALINFFAVPVVAILGVIVGNALLKALDGATNSGDASKGGIINVIMYSITADALYCLDDSDQLGLDLRNANTFTDTESKTYGVYNLFLSSSDSTIDSVKINNYFKQGVVVKYNSSSNGYNIEFKPVDTSAIFMQDKADKLNNEYQSGQLQFSYSNVELVEYFFAFRKVNFILGFLVLKYMFTISFGLVKRIFSMALLIIVSPPIVAISPIQPDALKNWRKKFIEQMTSVYGTIVGLNLYIILIPHIQKIQLIGFAPLDWLLNMLFVVAGLMVIQDFAALISSLYGGGDLWKDSNNKDGSMWKKPASFLGTSMSNIAGAPFRAVEAVKGFTNMAKYEGLGKASLNALQTLNNNTPMKDFFGENFKNVKDGFGGKEKLANAEYKKTHNEDGIKEARSEIDKNIKNINTQLTTNATEMSNTNWAKDVNFNTNEERFTKLMNKKEAGNITDAERAELSGLQDRRAEYSALQNKRQRMQEELKTAQKDKEVMANNKLYYNGKEIVQRGGKGKADKEANEAMARSAGRSAANAESLNNIKDSLQELKSRTESAEYLADAAKRTEMAATLAEHTKTLELLKRNVSDPEIIKDLLKQIKELERKIDK